MSAFDEVVDILRGSQRPAALKTIAGYVAVVFQTALADADDIARLIEHRGDAFADDMFGSFPRGLTAIDSTAGWTSR